MPQADQEEKIVFGPGGQILNVAKIEVLSKQLQEKPLSTDELLRLAKFYKAYPTGVPLGNHLALLALAARNRAQVSQKVFTEYDDVADATEDSGEVPKVKEARERGEDESIQLAVHRALISGIGLLIETVDFKSKSGVRSIHFVIAVSPPVDKVPEVSRLRVHPRTSK